MAPPVEPEAPLVTAAVIVAPAQEAASSIVEPASATQVDAAPSTELVEGA